MARHAIMFSFLISLSIMSCIKFKKEINKDVHESCIAGVIHGYDKPLHGVIVGVNKSLGVVTDSLGLFVVCGEMKKNNSLFIGRVRYHDKNIPDIPTVKGKISILEIYLTRDEFEPFMQKPYDVKFLPLETNNVKKIKEQVLTFLKSK